MQFSVVLVQIGYMHAVAGGKGSLNGSGRTYKTVNVKYYVTDRYEHSAYKHCAYMIDMHTGVNSCCKYIHIDSGAP